MPTDARRLSDRPAQCEDPTTRKAGRTRVYEFIIRLPLAGLGEDQGKCPSTLDFYMNSLNSIDKKVISCYDVSTQLIGVLIKAA